MNKEIFRESIEGLVVCDACGRKRGIVEGEYNKAVPVFCSCDIELIKRFGGNFPSPSMISRDKKIWWTPTTDHQIEDGSWWHTPYYGGYPIEILLKD